jgi:hypothetical protein
MMAEHVEKLALVTGRKRKVKGLLKWIVCLSIRLQEITCLAASRVKLLIMHNIDFRILLYTPYSHTPSENNRSRSNIVIQSSMPSFQVIVLLVDCLPWPPSCINQKLSGQSEPHSPA